ncbi:MAG: pyruvate kinase, partial [Nitratireductor sp.]|nr:pyruvate kinase [Nitratireductor sp.]
MRRNRRVKILATLGPASSSREMIHKLFVAGADVFRINMSHTDHETMRRLVATIREVETDNGRPIGILCDLQGPKHRLGKFAAGQIAVKPGDRITLDDNPAPGDETRVQLPHPQILAALKPGDRILVDDGRVSLTAVKCTPTSVLAEVVNGTKLSDRKGVSLPDTEIGESAMTDKDRKDLEAAIAAEVDWVALSFVQRPEDLAEVRKIARGRVAVMAKIEKPQAIQRIEEIIDLADAIMVARGDLGVEMPLEAVPGIQKQIVRRCRKAGKPVVVATQMLESMISAPVPTRAEVSDVAG